MTDNLVVQYPAQTSGVAVATGVKLSGTGIAAGTGVGEYELTMEYNTASASVVVTAQAIDINGNVLSTQPTITAQSTQGQSSPQGEQNANSGTYPPANCIGQQYWNSINATDSNGGAPIIAGTSYSVANAIASVSAVVAGVCTVTLQNIGECIVEFSTPQGFSARLNVSGVNL